MTQKGRSLRMGHLYPDFLNIYGDIGNVRVLAHRARARGIQMEVIPLSLSDQMPKELDLLFIGGGQDIDQARICKDLVAIKKEGIVRLLDEGVAMLAVCGGYQLLGRSYIDANGEAMEGIGVLDVETHPGEGRWIGNVAVLANQDLHLTSPTIVGFENHGGRTRLGATARPLGTVTAGGGNNGEDGTEGCVGATVIGTYLHGSLLPKNPAVADWLLSKALTHAGHDPSLEELDDSAEAEAHRYALNLACRDAKAGAGVRPTPRRGKAS